MLFSTIQAESFYMNDYHWSTKVTTWTEKDVEYYRNRFTEGNLSGSYGINNTNNIERHMREYMADTIKGKIIIRFDAKKPRQKGTVSM